MAVNSNWREMVAKRERETGARVVYVEMSRPQDGICIFESPEYGITRRFEDAADFARALKRFIDETLGPAIAASGGTSTGTVDLLLWDEKWKDA